MLCRIKWKNHILFHQYIYTCSDAVFDPCGRISLPIMCTPFSWDKKEDATKINSRVLIASLVALRITTVDIPTLSSYVACV